MFFSIFLSYLYFPVLFPGIFFSISRLFFSVLDLLALLSTGEIIVVRSAPTAAAQFYFPQNESQVFSSNNSIFAKKLQILFFGSVLFLKNTYDRTGVFLWSFFVDFEWILIWTKMITMDNGNFIWLHKLDHIRKYLFNIKEVSRATTQKMHTQEENQGENRYLSKNT